MTETKTKVKFKNFIEATSGDDSMKRLTLVSKNDTPSARANDDGQIVFPGVMTDSERRRKEKNEELFLLEKKMGASLSKLNELKDALLDMTSEESKRATLKRLLIMESVMEALLWHKSTADGDGNIRITRRRFDSVETIKVVATRRDSVEYDNSETPEVSAVTRIFLSSTIPL